MATVNEQLADEAISHSIDLTRYSNSVIRRIIALLNKTDRDLANQITAALERLPAESFTVERLDALLQSVRQTNAVAYQQVSQLIETELKDLVQYEAAYQYQLFQSTLPVQVSVAAVNVGQVYAASLSRPFQGTLLKECLAGLEANKARMVRDAIRIGYVEGQTIQQITQRIMGTRALQYTDGLMETSRRDAAAMVRTAVSHTANFTRNEFYKQNDDLVKGIKWISTLDGRTSAVCRARDGEVYPIDSGPRPPAHWNCLPGSAMVSVRGSITRAYKRPYKGQLVIIKTASGREISCTPNHPILSDRGWVSAQSLNLGNNIVCDGLAQGKFCGNSENYDVPSRIEDVAESFFISSGVLTIEVPISAPDFHGDGIGSQVAVVGTNGGLLTNGNTSFSEHFGECRFGDRHSPIHAALESVGSLDLALQLNDSPGGGDIGGPGDCGFFLGAGLCHSGELLLAPVAQRESGFLESQLCRSNRNAEAVSNSANSDSAIKHGLCSINVESANGSLEPSVIGDGSPSFCTVGIHDSDDHLVSNAEQICDFGNAESCGMEVCDLNDRDVNDSTVRSDSVGFHDVKHVGVCHAEFCGNGRRQHSAIVHGDDVGNGLVSGELHLLNSSSQLDSFCQESVANRTTRNAEHAPNLIDADALLIERKNLVRIENFPPLSFDSGAIEPTIDYRNIDAEIARNILNGDSGPVFLDDIISINTSEFSGHVYNLETDCGWFVSDGIITHNCRSSTTPVIKSWKELGIDLPESAASTRASMSGQVPDDMTYSDWLKKQPVERQDDILGKTKGQLFRKGGLSLTRFVDRNGRELNLAELRAKNASAFAKAGL